MKANNFSPFAHEHSAPLNVSEPAPTQRQQQRTLEGHRRMDCLADNLHIPTRVVDEAKFNLDSVWRQALVESQLETHRLSLGWR